MTRTTHLLAGLALVLAGCADAPAAPEADKTVDPTTTAAAVTGQEARGLATARAATARFQRFEEALDAGYTFLFEGMCMEGGSGDNVGGMGYHYVNLALLDGQVDVANPEALLYEPGPNGQMRLVAVEYVIPAPAWTGSGLPTLLGQDLGLNSFDLYALHAWIWKSNPDGMFKPWNPNVSCTNATASMTH